MRLPLVGILFILLLIPNVLAENSVRKEIWFTDVKIQTFYSTGKETQVSNNDRIIVSDGIEIASPEYNTSAHLVFPIGSNFWMGPYTHLWIDNYSVFPEGWSISMRVRGVLDVKNDEPTEVTMTILQTDQAEAEISSRDFSVITEDAYTFIECYSGTVTMMDADAKVITVGAGNVIKVFGHDGEKNSTIRVSPIQSWRKEKRIARLESSPQVKWADSSSSQESP